MKKVKMLLPLIFALTLTACNSGSTSESGNESEEESESTSTSTSEIEYLDVEDDGITDRNDGVAAEYTPISDGYTVGSGTNSTSYDYDDIIVNGPTNELSSDFAYGVDVSSLYEVEKYGGRFYDKDGNEADVFTILKEGGANYARFRLWVDPYDGNGNAYGGGTNDLATDIYLAQRAQAAGLKIMVDFHYSDSWADPSKQFSPKAWIVYKRNVKYVAAGDYVSGVLNAFKEAGVTVDAMQSGNEINNGIAGITAPASKYYAMVVKAGIDTAKSIFPDIKTVVHYTNVSSGYSYIGKFLSNLAEWGVEWDVTGLSYYPYWHGSQSNLLEIMNSIVEDYGTEVMILETSWGFTDDSTEYASNQYNTASFGTAGGYETSTQAQATEIADLVDLLSQVSDSKGTGIFYWEPAWLPVNGSGWITKYGYYYNEHGTDWVSDGVTEDEVLSSYSNSSCLSSWSNQALFDYSGKVLPSAYTYAHIQNRDKEAEEVLESLVEASPTYTVDITNTWSLPTTVQISTNTGALRDVEVTWNETDLAAITTSGIYSVTGTAGGFSFTATVKAMLNHLQDPSFEKQGCSNESAVVSPWDIETTYGYKTSIGDAHIEAKSELSVDGSAYFHWYTASTVCEFTLSQTMTNIAAGTYTYGCQWLTSWYALSGSETTAATLWYQIGSGDKVEVSKLSAIAGYESGVQAVEVDNIVVSKTSTVTIGFSLTGNGGCWGHADAFYFADAFE